jgi:WD40 repeat protein
MTGAEDSPSQDRAAGRLQPRLHCTLEGHQGAVYDLAVSDEGDLLSVGGDGLLVRWSRVEGAWNPQGLAVARAAAPLFAVCCTPDGAVLAGTGDGGVLALGQDGAWEVKPAHPGGTYVVTPDATGGADGRWLSWPDGADLAQVPGRLRCHFKTEAGEWLGTSEGRIHARHNGGGVQAHEGAVRALMAWPGKEALASAGSDGRIQIWKQDREGLSPVLTLDAHKGAIYRMAASPDGRWVATCSRDKSLAVWDAEGLDLVVRIARPHWPAHTRSVNAMCWLSSGMLATAGDDGRILIWDVVGREAPAGV